MIAFAIFLLHFIFLVIVGLKILKKESFKQAFYNLIFMIIVFSIGWALSTMFTNAIFPPGGYSKELNLDTISLLILSFAEAAFYKFYYSDLFTISDGKEK